MGTTRGASKTEEKYRTDADSDSHDVKEKQQIDLLLQFFEASKNYCVCMIDMVESTSATMNMSNEKIGRYYGIFLNMMAEIASSFGAVVVKNIGDSLLYYFPGTDLGTPESFRNVLRCCMAMLNIRPSLNNIMIQEGLPEISYRISCEYGSVAVARMSTSSVNDIFGMSVNMCSKINPMAPANTMIIGEAFYGKVNTFDDEYVFEERSAKELSTLPADGNYYHVYIVK
ncbi:MAG TPA: adenylate/guanylate cyclase domain-containing protein, partial [Nitrososphaera sp.]|nr:adenylate/guanylate cyclase domain-containing protein [Nitrososphaera sp.]